MSWMVEAKMASAATDEAAAVVYLRWAEGRIGGGEAADARVLRALNALDALADELRAIERLRGRPSAPELLCRRVKRALAASAPFVPRAKPLQSRDGGEAA